MKTSILLFTLFACVGILSAQDAEPKKGASTLIDAAKRLLEGNKGKISDETRRKAEEAARAAMNAVPDELKNKAQQLVTDPKAAAARQQAIETVQGAMKSRDEPPAPATPTEVVAVAKPADAAAAAKITGPQPQRLRPLVFETAPVADPSRDILITATQSGSLDPNTGIGIYRGNVKVRHPSGTIECDELEVHMKKDSSGQIVGDDRPKRRDADILATSNEKSATTQAGLLEKSDPPFDIAYARGSMIRVVKIDADGTLQTAHCNEVAVYDNRKDTITLRGMPSIQVADRLIEATDPRCYLIIDGDGKLHAEGGVFKTTLLGSQPPPSAPAQN